MVIVKGDDVADVIPVELAIIVKVPADKILRLDKVITPEEVVPDIVPENEPVGDKLKLTI